MKTKVFIHAEYGSHYLNGEYVKGFAYKPYPVENRFWGMMVAELEVEFPDVDEAELKNGTVKLFQAEQQSIRAEAEGRVQEIQTRIQELLCIENKSAELVVGTTPIVGESPPISNVDDIPFKGA